MTDKNLTPAKLALLQKWLQGRQSDHYSTGIPLRPPGSPLRISLSQQRLLFMDLLDRGAAVNNLSVLLRLRGRLDVEALHQSAHQIMERHEVLRMYFAFGSGMPTPGLLDDLTISIPLIKVQGLDENEREQQAVRQAQQEVLQPFDLSAAPLLRLRLYPIGEDHHLLLLTAHHTIADGWSLGVLLRELMMFYQAHTSGVLVEAPPLPVQYSDYAYWQTDEKRLATLKPSLDYWKSQLEGELPILELPADRARGVRQSTAGGTHRFVVSKDKTQALEIMARREDATMYMILLTAFYLLLHRYSGQEDILVGTPVANRNQYELEHLIGVFINALALRVNLSGNPGFRELLMQVRRVSLDGYAHQDFPFEKLVEELKPQRHLNRHPLFQVIFNLQNSPLPRLDIAGLETTFLDIDRGGSLVDLTLMFTRKEDEYHATVEYSSDLFQAPTIARMFRSYLQILEHAVSHPDDSIATYKILTDDDLHRLVHRLNQTSFDFPRDKCLHQLIEEQTERSPDSVAVVDAETCLTYRELNLKANALARRLQDLGIGPERRVGLLMKRSVEMVAAFLAIFKAGGAYVPIHTSFPVERIQIILKDADVEVLITDLDLNPSEWTATPILRPQDDVIEAEPMPVLVTPNQLAYIIYTSGSTGTPKGVMINQLSLVNFLCSMLSRPGMQAGDVLMAVTSVSFDISTLELFLPLMTGATVVVADEETTANPTRLAEALHAHQVNIMQATPATWQLLLDAGWAGRPGLKALCGGDALTRTLANRLLDRVGSLWNMYGPTETTVWSSALQIQAGDAPISIGQPIGNTSLYILDRYQVPVPPGVVGELHIGGMGLARGYLHQPELTREKFIPDTISAQPGGKLYKTGDLARFGADDAIEILGRTDDQLKLNGHRIELGEIRAVLIQHPAVRDALVIPRTEMNGNKRLIAYFVCGNAAPPDAAEMRDFFKKKLPAYMTPAFFICLESLPLTPNGKINRKALPLPAELGGLSGYVAPRNKEEHILAEIWQDALQVEQVGIHDNFFDLGGASIQSIQVVVKANMYGYRIGAEHIFEYQTIAELATFIQGES